MSERIIVCKSTWGDDGELVDLWEECRTGGPHRSAFDHRTAILLDADDEKVIEIAESSAVTILERSLLSVLRPEKP